jgi:membrane protein required for colicin V production
MTLFDYVVLTIVCLSVFLSVMRGFVREVLALVGWIGAFVAAMTLGGPVSAWMAPNIADERWRAVAAFGGVFFATLLLASLVAIAFSRLLKAAGLRLEDRVLGGVFGLARGLLIVMVLVLLGGVTKLPKQPAWNDAMLSPPLEALAGAVKPWLPQGLSQYISYD